MADAFNQAWPSPGMASDGSVDCSAIPPSFCITIAGVPLCINPDDLKELDSNGNCYSTVHAAWSGSGNLYLLGDTFLKNVVAVYDWADSAMG